MNFIILGMGSIGSLWASLLHLKGHSIQGVCRGEHCKNIKTGGLVFESIDNQKIIINTNFNFRIYNEEVFESELRKSHKMGDCVIITCKAHNLSETVKQYLDILKENKNVLLIQNGIGNEEIIKDIIPDIVVYRATTTMGSYIANPGHIRHTGLGLTKIGIPSINAIDLKEIDAYKDKLLEIVEIFNKSGIETEFCEDIDLILWEKILINVGINAPAALRNIRNGDLLKSEKIKDQMKYAIIEAWNVGKKIGIPLKEDPQFYIDLTYEVARKTAQNKNSMLQDVLRGKTTEIDFINGKIVDYANKIGMYAPENEKLTNSIKDLGANN